MPGITMTDGLGNRIHIEACFGDMKIKTAVRKMNSDKLGYLDQADLAVRLIRAKVGQKKIGGVYKWVCPKGRENEILKGES